MPGLSDSQLAVIRRLVDTAPDSAIRSLDMALAAETEGAMAMIRKLVNAEAAERKARAMVFGPVMALCPRQPTLRHDCFPFKTPVALWKALKTVTPVDVEDALIACAAWRRPWAASAQSRSNTSGGSASSVQLSDAAWASDAWSGA